MMERIAEEPWVVTFDLDDSVEEKLKKAAHVKPSEAQLAWMEKEFNAFVHFGPNTFTNMQWGTDAYNAYFLAQLQELLTQYGPISEVWFDGVGYALSYWGYLYISTDDTYTFRLDSADGSILYLGGSLFLNNDEPHEQKAVMRTVSLKEGYYPIKVLYTSFRHHGLLQIDWESSDFAWQEIASNNFFCDLVMNEAE
jgi:hypothetical protein